MLKPIPFHNDIWRLCLILVFILPGCTKEQDAGDDLPVVESYLIPGQKMEVKISQKNPYDPDAPLPMEDVDSLTIRVGSQGASILLVPSGGGLYRDSLGELPVVAESIYDLSFIFHGEPVSAYTEVPYKPVQFKASPTSITFPQRDPENPGFYDPPDPIVLSWTNADTGYYLISVTCIDSNAVSVIKDSVPEDMTGAFQPFVADTFELREMMFSYFGTNRVILYHINPEYTSFFRSWMTNTQSYEEPPSNVINGLGIFTGINADTLYVEVIQSK